MMKPLSGSQIAVLMSNGFNEQSFVAVQKMMMEMGANLKIISTNQGLVNGWDGSGWGHNFAVDAPLNTALGVDYDALIIPGGERSIEKLKMTAHTRRFIGSFMAAEKVVCAMDDALALMAYAEQITGRQVCGPETVMQDCKEQGAEWMNMMMVQDDMMLSGMCDAENMNTYLSTMRDMLIQNNETPMDQAA